MHVPPLMDRQKFDESHQSFVFGVLCAMSMNVDGVVTVPVDGIAV